MILLILTQKVNQNDAILGFFVEWLDRMAARVDRLQVIALEGGGFDLPKNVEVISLGKDEGAGSLAMLVRFQKVLWRLCRKEKPHTILCHMVPRYVLYAAPLAKLFRVPIDLWYTHKGVDKYLRMAHPFLRHAFTASKESFRLESPKKVVTGHGINTERFKPDEDAKGGGILTVGRVTPSKDQQVIVEAVARLKEKRSREDLQTRIVGEPLLDSDREYLGRIKSIVTREGLEGLVHFAGTVPHGRLAEEYRRARITVNASHTGSVDKVVLEAMAAGSLPLTCNESFIPLLGDLAEKLAFEKGNPDDLAERIGHLLDLGEGEREELARRLREIVIRDHGLDDLIDKILRKMKG